MSAVAIGLMVIKLLIGHLSDNNKDQKFYPLSLLSPGLGIVCVLLAKSRQAIGLYRINGCIGIFGDIPCGKRFLCNGNGKQRKNMGKYTEPLQGYHSLLASVGGMISGLYQFKEGEYALYICSFSADSIYSGPP